MTANQGGAAEFLNGGKLFDPSGAVADMMKIAEATSDPIESFFGTHDRVTTVQSKNTSFHVTSALATWNHNKTSSFLQTLTSLQRAKLLRAAVWHGARLKQETDKCIADAAEHKLARLKKEASVTRASEKNLIHDLLDMRAETLFKTVAQYEAFKRSVYDDDKKVIKELKKQVRLLHKVIIPT